jgi:hypothetical protein
MRTIPSGDSYNIEVQVVNEVNNIETPFDISGWSLRFTIETLGTEVTVFDKYITSHTDALNGISECPMSDEETSIPAGDYILGIRAYDSYQNPMTISQENIRIGKTMKTWRNP